MKKITFKLMALLFLGSTAINAAQPSSSKLNEPVTGGPLHEEKLYSEQEASQKIVSYQGTKIAFYGGAHVNEKYKPFYDKAFALAQRLAENNVIVISGGGMGIMEAANCGAQAAKNKNRPVSIGVNVKGLPINNCIDELIIMPTLFPRLLTLIQHTDAFVILPGGYGTAQEIFSILTLMKLKKIDPDKPIILMGKEYWQSLVDWINLGIAEEFIPQDVKNKLRITDDVDEAVQILLRKK